MVAFGPGGMAALLNELGRPPQAQTILSDIALSEHERLRKWAIDVLANT
jgi:hypothetical protein